MEWLVSRILVLPLWIYVVVVGPIKWFAKALSFVFRTLSAVHEGLAGRFESGRKLAEETAKLTSEQSQHFPLRADRQTVFLLITCGQAVRNFLLSDVLALLRERFNVVILSPYASSRAFRARYLADGVHVLPWFENFRSPGERFFHYHLMATSGSGTHQGWLRNLDARAKQEGGRVLRHRKHQLMRRGSVALGALLGARRMLALYHAFALVFVPKRLLEHLFGAYRPALVISTTAHHVEAWSLTLFGRRSGVRTLGNILSWDNPTTKAAMDTSCEYYTVWSDEMKGELAKHYSYLSAEIIVTGCPLFDIYYNRPGAMSREDFLRGLGLRPELPYILYATNTPAAMPDESQIVLRYWEELKKSRFGGKVSLLVRLHPKENRRLYAALFGQPDVAVTVAGPRHWSSSDRWLPTPQDMTLLLNSMMHAAVSVNVASTMTLESFALELPTINVGFRSSDSIKDETLLWSFDMYHTSDHYRAIIDNGAVDLPRSMDQLVECTINALEHGNQRLAGMRKTLAQKAAYCDGTSARRFVEAVEGILQPAHQAHSVRLAPSDSGMIVDSATPTPHATAAE
jgi:hypothetical protein